MLLTILRAGARWDWAAGVEAEARAAEALSLRICLSRNSRLIKRERRLSEGKQGVIYRIAVCYPRILNVGA